MIIQSTIDIYNAELDDMGIESLMPVRFCVNTDDICAVREHVEKGETEPRLSKCVIYLKSGESFIVYLNYDYLVSQLQLNSNK
jgi:hypothetical protein